MLINNIVFILVWSATVALLLRERKGRQSAEAQILALSGQVAKIASESAIANAGLVAAQAPLVQHHEMLLDYLRKNDGTSIDDAKQALKALAEGIESASARVTAIRAPAEPLPNPEIGEAKEALKSLRDGIDDARKSIAAIRIPKEIHDASTDESTTHHKNILAVLRANPGRSVDEAKEALAHGD